MADYRDPKVTTTDKKSGGMMRWVWIALGIILLLLVLGWLLGAFDNEVEEVELIEPEAVVVEEEVAEPDVVVIEEDADVIEEEVEVPAN